MEILRIFNNNLVLALDEAGREVILTGRGLGFQARPGQEADPERIVRVFVPSDGRDPDHLAGLLAGIPPEHIHLVVAALGDVGLEGMARNPALVVALADHVSFALRRIATGMELEYPLLAEVRNLYPREYAQAHRLLATINRLGAVELPPNEAVGLALHLVNAGFTTGDLSFTYTMTGVIQQMVAVIEQSYGLSLDPAGVSLGRFVTHLRYLFVRIHNHNQLNQRQSSISAAIRQAHPEAVECAARVARIIELRLDAALTEDELCYLTLHIARVAADQDQAPATG